MPKHRAGKLTVSERNDINIRRLAHYAAAMVEYEKTMGSVENKPTSENCNKTSASEAVTQWTFSSLGSHNGGKQSD